MRIVRVVWLRKLGVIACVVAGLYCVATVPIVYVGLRDNVATADLIVVPGNTVRPDGSLSERLKSRLDIALRLFKERRAPTIFVSGGVGREGQDEADAMAAYLMANGIPSEAIVRDPLGVDTAATAANAAKYLHANKLHSALVATQYFHVARTSLALQRNGVIVAGTAHARYFEFRDAYSLAREVLGYAVYYLTL